MTMTTMIDGKCVAAEALPAGVRCLVKGADWLLVLCPSVNEQVLEDLCALPEQAGVARLVVYAPRPKALAALLAERGVEAQVHGLREALTQGQGGRK